MSNYTLQGYDAWKTTAPEPAGVCPPCAAEDARLRLTSLAEDCGCAWSDTLRDAAEELAEAAMEEARKDDVTYCNRHETKREDYD